MTGSAREHTHTHTHTHTRTQLLHANTYVAHPEQNKQTAADANTVSSPVTPDSVR